MLRSFIEFADPLLARGGVYPDDFNLTAPNPNAHSTAVRHRVLLVPHDHEAQEPTLRSSGLQFADLNHLPGLSALLSRLAHATARTGSERLDDEQVHAVRHAFQLSHIPLPGATWLGGGGLGVLHAAPAGIIARSVGPGVNFIDSGSRRERAGQYWRPMAHADQQVHGEPLRSLLGGLAPLLFASYSPLVLLNVWTPAQRVHAQPLVVMDTRTLNASDRLTYHIHASDPWIGTRLNDVWVRSPSALEP